MSRSNRDVAPHEHLLPGQSRQPAMSVLFIDPDIAAATRLARPLMDRYATAVVSSAHAARSAMSIRMPDVIVTELDLPDTSGLELIASLRTNPATRHILLMVVTHHTSVHSKIAAFQAGSDDYLVKPVEARQFETHLLLVSRFRKVIPT